MDPVAHTAFWVAAARAHESVQLDALVHDPFAAELAGEEGERWIGDEDGDCRLRAHIALRTRFFDDHLLRAARAGARQIVLLAAGLDARAYRLDWPAGTRLFEVDRPEVLAHKDRVLAGAPLRCTRRTLAADLTGSWAEGLRALGFRAGERSAWLAEGLLAYLHEEEVRRLLRTIAALSTPDSTLALDVAGRDPFTVPYFAPQAARMRAHGIAMHFVCDDPARVLAEHGFASCSVTMTELAARLGRPFPKNDDEVRAHLVCATRSDPRPATGKTPPS
jgi:methyltransferase (TIGR00027 family)